MFEAKVMSCKKSEFEDRRNAGRMITGYTVAVALPGNNGWIEVWCNAEHSPGDTVILEVTEGKYHKPKVRVV